MASRNLRTVSRKASWSSEKAKFMASSLDDGPGGQAWTAGNTHRLSPQWRAGPGPYRTETADSTWSEGVPTSRASECNPHCVKWALRVRVAVAAVLLVLGGIAAVLTGIGQWADSNVLSTNGFTSNASATLERQPVQDAIARSITGQLEVDSWAAPETRRALRPFDCREHRDQ